METEVQVGENLISFKRLEKDIQCMKAAEHFTGINISKMDEKTC